MYSNQPFMKNLVLAVVFLASITVYGQHETGIHFEHAASWKAVKEKAKAENKYIFMDAFTTWCGPCKLMTKNIFPLPEVGNFFNEHYISLKVQLDTTSRDNADVKSWYADAHQIMNDYKVMVFPTYLFFSPEGKLVHRAVGSSGPEEFINKGKDALDPGKQYFTLAARYETGERKPEFLKQLTEAALAAYDKEKISGYASEYISTQKNMLTEDNIRFLEAFTQTINDAGFTIISTNQEAYDQVLGKGKADEKIKAIILQELVYPKLFGNNEKPNWKKLETEVATKFPSLAGEIISNAKIIYYNNNGDWPAFTAAVSYFLQHYGNRSSADELNEYAWTIFQNCNEMACIKEALGWSKLAVEKTNNPTFMDTYANLLYRTGHKDLAIKWEQKALNILKEKNEDITDFEATIEKMKNGEKTW